MKPRKSWIIALTLSVITAVAYVKISEAKKKVPKNKTATIAVALYKTVSNEEVAINIQASGKLEAKNTFSLYSEVTGVMLKNRKEFRKGTHYKKGELIYKVDDSEIKGQLYSMRSDFLKTLTSVMPDLRIEFPNEYEKWQKYLNQFEIERTIRTLPILNSDKEKYFVSAKNIFSLYYSIKNLEARFSKYSIRAPFNGVITEANIKPGGLVRSGQNIGTFTNDDEFELEVQVKSRDASHIAVGNAVEVISSDKNKVWSGVITRVNTTLDMNSQTVSVFVETKGEGLKPGMFLDVNIKSTPNDNATHISRSIIHNRKFVYLVKDSTLVEFEINPVKYTEKEVIVDNLIEGEMLVTNNILGAYPGMKVNPKKAVE